MAAGTVPPQLPDELEQRCAPGAGRVGRTGPLRAALVLFVSMLPVTLIVPVLKELLADGRGASALWTHLFMSVNLIGAVGFAPLIAALCERARSRSRLAAWALALDAALFAAMWAAPTLWALMALRTLEGAAHMLALSALMACGADLAPPQQRGRIMGLLGACLMLGTAAGTRLGGLIWARLGAEAAFPSAACLALAGSMLALATLRDAGMRQELVRFSEVLRALSAQRRLAIAYVYTFVDRFCVGVIITSFGLFLSAAHGITPDGRSRLLTMFLIPFAVCVYPAGRLVDRVGFTAPLVLGSCAFGVLFAGYGVAPASWLPAAMIASGLASAAMFAPTLSLCAHLAPQGLRGAAFSGFNAAGSLGFLCGPIVGGWVVELTQGELSTVGAYRLSFVICGASQVVCALATLPLLRAVRAAPSGGGASGVPVWSTS